MALSLALCAKEKMQTVEPHMGTLVRITVYSDDSVKGYAAMRAAMDRIAELDRIFSDYNPESEVSRLSRSKAGLPVPVSEDMVRLLSRALEISALTEFAFDVTAGALTQEWRRGEPLTGPAGARHLRLDASSRAVTILHEGVRLDFGGIAKGFAAQEAVRTLRERGVPIALVAISGDIAAGEAPPGTDGWRVGIEAFGRQTEVVSLVNESISTSGDTEQFRVNDGRRESHILDPRTRQPITRRIAVTVIAKSGADADAFATALSVLGPEKGLAAIRSATGVDARIRTEDGVYSTNSTK